MNQFETESTGFDELFDDNNFSNNEEVVDVNENLEPEDFNEGHNDPDDESREMNYMHSFLKEYGINDGKISYENEDGTTEEIDFDSLDSEEKLNILKEITNPSLSQDEVNVINYLRQNNATFQDVIEYYKQKAVDEYINNNYSSKEYKVDDYTDDELYVADMKMKFSDMSDEELVKDLENAKENEDLFKKKVEAIRKHYKTQEDEQANEAIKAKEAQYNNFKDSITDTLNNFNEISMDYKDKESDSLVIEGSEKEEIWRYILNRDENGYTQFYKDLNDPVKIVKFAWFNKYGDEAISNISSYWKNELKKMRKSDNKAQTTVRKTDNTNKKDNFYKSRDIIETYLGDDLL